MTEPLAVGLVAEFIVAIATIIFGIVFEKGRKDRFFVFAYLFGFVVMVITTNFDFSVFPLLLIYSGIGLFFAIMNWKRLFGLFGSKVYGSLLFTIACLHTAPVQEQLKIMLSVCTTTESQLFFLEFYYVLLCILWFIVALIVWGINRKIHKYVKRI